MEHLIHYSKGDGANFRSAHSYIYEYIINQK